MKKLLIVLVVAFCCGCGPHQTLPLEYDIAGTVRNVWALGSTFHVVFEHDNGISQTMYFANHPPVWAGEHVKMRVKKVCIETEVCDYPRDTVDEVRTERL